MTIESMQKKKGEYIAQLDELCEVAKVEERELSADEQEKFDDAERKVKLYDDNIKRSLKMEAMKKEHNRINEIPIRDSRAIAPSPAPSINENYPLGDSKTLSRYSFQDVVRRTFQNKSLDGLEAEMEVECRNEILPMAGGEGGNYIPFKALAQPTINRRDWQRHRMGNFRNDLGVITHKGGELVEESDLMSPIDILYEYMVLSELGVPTLTGLGPDIRYPTFAAGSASPAEKAQDADATELEPTTDDFELSPKRLPIYTKLNQQIVIQSSYNIEAWLMDFLMKQIAQRIQNAFINGTGTAPQPQGILATATAPLGAAQTIAAGTNGDAVSRDKLLALMGKIDENNAWMGRTGFLMNSKTRNKLQRTLLDTGSGRFVMEGMGIPSIGQPVAVTNQVPSSGSKGSGTGLSTVVFGNWLDSVMAQWGGMWTLRDPYTEAKKGLTSLHAATYYDCKVLRAVSFAKAVHLITT